MGTMEDLLTVGLYDVSKRLRRYNCRNRWLRRDLFDRMRGRRRTDEWLQVLHGINIEVRLGESIGIVGANGSGKSTLLKLIAGIMRPTTGSILRRGSVCAMLDVCAGFQEDLTGRENVFINGAILGLSQRYLSHAMPQIEGFAELEGFLDTPMRYYSSGMRARLGFAVAMNADPDVFLIDEVLAVGDEGFRRKCYAHLDKLVSGGTTVIIVSHDPEALQRLCARGIWISDGTIKADGPMEEVSRAYVDSFGANMLRSTEAGIHG